MMATVVELSPGGPVRVFVTGGSDMVLSLASHTLRLPTAPPPPSGARSSTTAPPPPPVREALSPAAADALVADVIVNMARQSLRTLGLAYRDFDSAASLPDGWEDAPAALEQGMTLYAILGIKDPLRKVRACEKTRAAACTLPSFLLPIAGRVWVHRAGAGRGRDSAHGDRRQQDHCGGHR